MTPTQLRAFAAVVRSGSVKQAAADLEVTEAAVSLHVGQLRKELGDQLFTRTNTGLSFTPGGLRLASRAAELLSLQDRTVHEVRQAGGARRLLRLAASGLFAEHAAPGLIDAFADRVGVAGGNGGTAGLDIELSSQNPRRFESLLLTRTVDAAIGPRPAHLDPAISGVEFLSFQVVAVAAPDHPMTRFAPTLAELREQTWLLGPSAAHGTGVVPDLLRRVNVPEERQLLFQSQAAAVEEAKRGKGIHLAVAFAVAPDLAAGDLKRVHSRSLQAQGTWSIFTLSTTRAPAAATDLVRFITTPRATHAMLRDTGVTLGRFRPSVNVTLWG